MNTDLNTTLLSEHMKALFRNDLTAIMKDYTENSVMIMPHGIFKGLEQIQKLFEQTFTQMPKNQTTHIIKKQVVSEDMAYVIWSANAPSTDIIFATDTFFIQEGKIARQSFAGYIKRKDK
jgi:ketosteroid isomerase-like protein